MLHRVEEELYDSIVRAVDGDVGKVYDFYFDDQHWAVRYVVVDTDSWLGGRRVLISPFAAEPPTEAEGVLPVTITQEQVENSPDIDLDKPVSRQQLIDLHEYYGWPATWAGSTLLGTFTVGAYPFVLAGAEAVEEEIEEEGLTEKYRGAPHLRSAREVIGYQIEARDGDIGRAADFFVGDEDWVIHYMLVDTRKWLPGREVLISPRWIDEVSWPESTVRVQLSRQQIEESPEYDPSATVTREYESALFQHYGFPAPWK